MKEQNKTPGKKNKKKIRNLLDAEFKPLVIRMLNEFEEKQMNTDNFNSITKDKKKKKKKNQSEIKNNLQRNNNRMDDVKNKINDLEHKEAKNNQSEQEEKESKKIKIV